jgi:hypothetical protein
LSEFFKERIMPPALDTLSATVTNAAAEPGGTAMTAVVGDSLALRSTGGRIRLLNMWAQVQAAGFVMVTSPKLTDATRGIRFRTAIADPKPFLPFESQQDMYSVDVLAPTLASAAGAGKIENLSLLIYYDDLPGSGARFIDVPTINKRRVEILTIESLITPTVGGTYSGTAALNVQSDLGKAGSDYALIGYRCAANGCTITWRGADSGNYRVSGPADSAGGQYTNQWFYNLSDYNQLPLIPVFAYNNKQGIFVELVANDALGVVKLTSILVRLA